MAMDGIVLFVLLSHFKYTVAMYHQGSRKRHPAWCRVLKMEVLERRLLLACATDFIQGLLTISCDDQDDHVILSRDDGGDITLNGKEVPGGPTVVNTDGVVIVAGDGSDWLEIDLSQGLLSPGETGEPDGESEIEVTIQGALGNDVLSVIGQDGVSNTFKVTGGALNFNGDDDGDIEIQDVEQLSIKGGNGDDVISLTGWTADDTDAAGITDIVIEGSEGDDVLRNGVLAHTTIRGGKGNDKLYGGTQPEVLNGNEGDDTLIGRGGHDTLFGEAGNDVIKAGSSSLNTAQNRVYVQAGDGDDTVLTFNGADTIYGGPGNDVIRGRPGNDLLYGGPGNDVLDGGNRDDTLYGGEGNDTLQGKKGDDLGYGGPNEDVLVNAVVDEGNDTLDGGEGSDLFRVKGSSKEELFVLEWVELYEGDPDDVSDDVAAYLAARHKKVVEADFEIETVRSAERVHIAGFGGSDSIDFRLLDEESVTDAAITELHGYGGGGKDTLYGGAAAEHLFGGGSRDMIYGGPGDDVLNGGSGANHIQGDRGHDTLIIYDTKFDFLSGGQGDDQVRLDQNGIVLDLREIPDGSFQSIESVDMTGNGNNKFVVTYSEVLSIRNNNDRVIVEGDEEDQVELGVGWKWRGVREDHYHRFVQTGATIWVSYATQTTPSPGVYLLDQLDGSDGFILEGIESNDRAGASVSSAGDMNGDGFSDLLIGAPQSDGEGKVDTGETYVAWGRSAVPESSFDLRTLDGNNGFRLKGVFAHDKSGHSVDSAGDINGDGYSDILIGAYGADPGGRSSAGETYVIFGKQDAFPESMELLELDGSSGFVLEGIDASDDSGYAVSSAGDINGDGYDDILIGARDGDPRDKRNAGETYVVFGKSGGFLDRYKLSQLDGSDGFILQGVDDDDDSGRAVSGAGDVNGDGYDDILIGALYADPSDASSAGETYLVFGRGEPFPPSMDLSDLDGVTGMVFEGRIQGDHSGRAVSSAGDVNGDGYDDILIGAPSADNHTGEAYVIFGKKELFSAVMNPDQLDGSNGFVINGEDAFDHFGYSVSTAGDVNQDGFADLVIGAYGSDPDEVNGAGSSYLIFGKGGDFASEWHVGELNGVDGTVFTGFEEDENAGYSVRAAGDVNGDGYSDLLVGSMNADALLRPDSGKTYVVFGHEEKFGKTLALSELNGLNGFVIQGGYEDDHTGHTVSTAGDVNGDGYSDLLIGAPSVNSSAGETVVVFGRVFGFPVILKLSELNGQTGFTLRGISANDHSGYAVSSAGDMNGDGYSDLLLGSPFADLEEEIDVGESYVVLGKGEVFPQSVDLASLTRADGFTIEGADGHDFAGYAVSPAGDVNGDGFDDILMGAIGAQSETGAHSVGESYVIFGTGDGFADHLELSKLDGNNGFALLGVDAEDYSGHSVGGAGDINGDGFDDVIIGAPYADSPAVDDWIGEAYLVFGHAGPFDSKVELENLDGKDGFVVRTGRSYDRLGWSVNAAGDINSDGFDDFLIGARVGGIEEDLYSGEVYVLFGSDQPFDAEWTLDGLDGSEGFVLKGMRAFDQAGFSLSTAGDVNRDGYVDILIGAYGADQKNGELQETGEAYVFYGRSGDFDASFELSDLNGINGFVLKGNQAYGRVGWSVGSAGDVNGDGYSDLILGADGGTNGQGDEAAGRVYVVFGDDFSGTRFPETSEIKSSQRSKGPVNPFWVSEFPVTDTEGDYRSSEGDCTGEGILRNRAYGQSSKLITRTAYWVELFPFVSFEEVLEEWDNSQRKSAGRNR